MKTSRYYIKFKVIIVSSVMSDPSQETSIGSKSSNKLIVSSVKSDPSQCQIQVNVGSKSSLYWKVTFEVTQKRLFHVGFKSCLIPQWVLLPYWNVIKWIRPSCNASILLRKQVDTTVIKWIRPSYNGIVESTKLERLRFFSDWTRWLTLKFPSVPPNLWPLHCKCQLDLLASFANHVRQGGASRPKQPVGAQTVVVALRSISMQLQLDGEQNPMVDAEGKHPKTISQILEGFRQEDPPAQQNWQSH